MPPCSPPVSPTHQPSPVPCASQPPPAALPADLVWVEDALALLNETARRGSFPHAATCSRPRCNDEQPHRPSSSSFHAHQFARKGLTSTFALPLIARKVLLLCVLFHTATSSFVQHPGCCAGYGAHVGQCPSERIDLLTITTLRLPFPKSTTSLFVSSSPARKSQGAHIYRRGTELLGVGTTPGQLPSLIAPRTTHRADTY